MKIALNDNNKIASNHIRNQPMYFMSPKTPRHVEHVVRCH